MMRLDAFPLAAVVLLSTFVVLAFIEPSEGKIQKATLIEGSKFYFSYELTNLDQTASRTGTLSATVKEVEWRGYDKCFMFNGTMSGTFTTQSGSGVESGTWKEYYLQGSLAFLDQTYVTDLVFGGNTVTNTTNLHYDPWLSWIEFPLEYTGIDKSMWSTDAPVSITTAWERIINGDEETSESGSDNEALMFDWICADLVKKDVDAGSFDTYWIREFVKDDEPRNQTTDYFYNETIGWWVEKNIYVDNDQGDPVRIGHYELTTHSFNHGPEIMGTPKITMDEDTTDRSMDLDEVFFDPDSDPLTYEVVDDGDLSVDIDQDNILTVTPPANYFGERSINVSADDGFNVPVTAVIPVEVLPVDDAAVLSQPSLAPSSGDEATVFTYSITYTDIDTLEPSSARVMIDSSPFDLTKISGDNRTGILFQYSTNLAPGEHIYSFNVGGFRYPGNGDLNGPSVAARSDPYLKEGSVTPGEGDVNTYFTFKVTWMGPNGEMPDLAKLVLDGSTIDLIVNNGDPMAGIICSDSRKLAEGGHSFHFEASLGADTFRFPESGNIDGPTVAGLEEPYLKEGGVDVEEGGLSTDLTFQVTWMGPNGETPNKVYLVLDNVEMTLFKESGTSKTGIIYSDSLRLGEGEHSFHFKASLGNQEYRFPRSGELDGPVVHAPEIIEHGLYHIRNEGDKAVYRFYFVYEYFLDVHPDEASISIDGARYDMQDVSGSPSSGANYSCIVSLPEGTYRNINITAIIDGCTFTLSVETLNVELKGDDDMDDTGDDTDDTGDDTGDGDDPPIAFIIGFVIVLLVVAIVIFILIQRKKPRPEQWKKWEEEEMEEVEGAEGDEGATPYEDRFR